MSKVVKKLSKSCQKVVKTFDPEKQKKNQKLSKNWQKTVKILATSAKKLNWQNV
jgi:hypothetical protein